MIAGHVEIFSLVPDLVHLLGMSKNSARAVAHNRALLPAPLKQLVKNFDIFLRDFVTIVVTAKASLPNVLGSALQIGGDDVPTDAAFRQMVERREAPGERIGMLERG